MHNFFGNRPNQQKGNMKLEDYIKKNKLSYSEAASQCKIHNINPSTNMWRYSKGQRIPRKEEMKKIYFGTNKQVQPNDFYDFVEKN